MHFVALVPTQITTFYSLAKNRYFPGVFGVREQRFATCGVFYFAAETRGNCIVTLVFNDVDTRKRQFTLNKMDKRGRICSICCVIVEYATVINVEGATNPIVKKLLMLN
jgi:hypothetical protein